MNRLPGEIPITEVIPEGIRVRRGAGRPQRGSQSIVLLTIEVRKRGEVIAGLQREQWRSLKP
jgi:hypothetical protein